MGELSAKEERKRGSTAQMSEDGISFPLEKWYRRRLSVCAVILARRYQTDVAFREWSQFCASNNLMPVLYDPEKGSESYWGGFVDEDNGSRLQGNNIWGNLVLALHELVPGEAACRITLTHREWSNVRRTWSIYQAQRWETLEESDWIPSKRKARKERKRMEKMVGEEAPAESTPEDREPAGTHPEQPPAQHGPREGERSGSGGASPRSNNTAGSLSTLWTASHSITPTLVSTGGMTIGLLDRAAAATNSITHESQPGMPPKAGTVLSCRVSMKW